MGPHPPCLPSHTAQDPAALAVTHRSGLRTFCSSTQKPRPYITLPGAPLAGPASPRTPTSRGALVSRPLGSPCPGAGGQALLPGPYGAPWPVVAEAWPEMPSRARCLRPCPLPFSRRGQLCSRKLSLGQKPAPWPLPGLCPCTPCTPCITEPASRRQEPVPKETTACTDSPVRRPHHRPSAGHRLPGNRSPPHRLQPTPPTRRPVT